MSINNLMDDCKAEVVSGISTAIHLTTALHDYYESLCILRLDSNTLTHDHLQRKTALLEILNELKEMYKK